jgi:hypothetical protein
MSRDTKITPNSPSRPGLVGLTIDRGRNSSPRDVITHVEAPRSGLESGSPMDRCSHESGNIHDTGGSGDSGGLNGPTGNWSQVTPAQWDRFWIEDYRVLFQNPTLLPTTQMTEIQRLNTLTRLILLIAIILAIFRVGNWLLFLVLGLGLVILLYYAQKQRMTSTSSPANPSSQEHYRCPHHAPSAQPAPSAARGSRLANQRSVRPIRPIRPIRLRPK